MTWRIWVVAANVLWFCGSAAAAGVELPPTHDFRITSPRLPTELEAGAIAEIPVVITNEGTGIWSSDSGHFLSYHWLDQAGEVVHWDGRRTAFEGPVPPGTELTLNASVEAPARPGRYRLSWDVVHEGVMWLSETDPTPEKPAEVSVVAGHSFEIVTGGRTSLLVSGRSSETRLRVRNTGVRRWLDDGTFALSYHWLNRAGEVVDWEGRRSFLPAEVEPGASLEIVAEIVAPSPPGLYRLQWDMVEEGVCWFSDLAPSPLASSSVLVVVDVFSSTWWWAILSLLGAAAAVSVARRAQDSRLVGLFAVADIFWCAGSLVVKQGSVLSTAGTHSTAGGLALTAGGACAVVLALLFLPAKWRVWCSWLVAAAGTAVLWADTLYVRFFGDLPGAESLSGLGQLSRVGASIRSLVEGGDFWLWADLLPGALLALVAARLSTRVGPRGRRITAGLLVVVAAVGALSAYRLTSMQPDLLAQVFRRLLVAREVGVLNLHALDVGRWSIRTRSGSGLDSDHFEAWVSWFAERAPLRAGVGPFFGAAEGLNLVTVQVESLQGFVIGLEIEGREVTPYLNRWRDDALWFTNVTDQTAQGRSSDSELATQVSLMPASGGAAAFRFAGNQFTGLAGIAGEHGYTTLSAVPYDGSFWNRRATHRAYGYSQSLFVDDFAAGEAVGWGLSDRDFLGQAVDRLAALQQPFAAWLLTLSLHHPFEGFPEHLEVLDVGQWQGTPFGSYLHTMRFFDESLAGFMAGLERTGLADSTVVVIWGDHDAGFEWRADIASAMGATHDPEGWYLSQEVPLFIRVPGRHDLRGEHDLPAGHVDVAPTLLALLGIDPASYAFVGRNLLGAPGDPPIVGEYACWRNRNQLFLQGDGTLETGLCLDVSTMERMPVGRCADGFEAARLTIEVSASVLEHDLQRRIHNELETRLGGAP